MTETPTSTAPLTPEDVAFVTERCLDAIANRFNERLIRRAADEAAALRGILTYNGMFGHYGDTYDLEGRGNKIRFSREGRSGVVTWTQIIRTVRSRIATTVAPADGVQLELFTDLP